MGAEGPGHRPGSGVVPGGGLAPARLRQLSLSRGRAPGLSSALSKAPRAAAGHSGGSKGCCGRGTSIPGHTRAGPDRWLCDSQQLPPPSSAPVCPNADFWHQAALTRGGGETGPGLCLREQAPRALILHWAGSGCPPPLSTGARSSGLARRSLGGRKRRLVCHEGSDGAHLCRRQREGWLPGGGRPDRRRTALSLGEQGLPCSPGCRVGDKAGGRLCPGALTGKEVESKRDRRSPKSPSPAISFDRWRSWGPGGRVSHPWKSALRRGLCPLCSTCLLLPALPRAPPPPLRRGTLGSSSRGGPFVSRGK